MARIVKAPKEYYDPIETRIRVFLAGSIEMGKAVNWQTQVENELANVNCVIYNPRRDDWDSSWKQDINNKQFREQVEWELNYLEKCDIIIVFIDPETKSPITLMELGLHAKSGKLVVYCPKGFWKKGNVDIVCKKYFVYQAITFPELINYVKFKIEVLGSHYEPYYFVTL